jgi:hypothetical protein
MRCITTQNAKQLQNLESEKFRSSAAFNTNDPLEFNFRDSGGNRELMRKFMLWIQK